MRKASNSITELEALFPPSRGSGETWERDGEMSFQHRTSYRFYMMKQRMAIESERIVTNCISVDWCRYAEQLEVLVLRRLPNMAHQLFGLEYHSSNLYTPTLFLQALARARSQNSL